MATTLSGKLNVVLQMLLQNTVGIAAAQAQIDKQVQQAFANGAGINQADRIFSNTYTIAASGTLDLDLAGSLTDAFGAVITLVRVKAIMIFALTTNVNNIVMGNAGAAQFVGPFGAAAHTLATKPGGITILVAPDASGWAVAAGTGDTLHFANSAAGSGVTFDLVIIGASA